jgi:hypothetical protein
MRVLADSLTVTFDEGGYAYTILDGTLGTASGHGNVLVRAAGPPAKFAGIRIDLPGASTVTHVCMDSYKNAAPPMSLGRGIWLYDAAGNRISYTFGNPSTYYLNYENSSSHQWISICLSVNISGVAYAIAQIGSDGAWNDLMDNVQITYTADSPTLTPTNTSTFPAVGIPYPACQLLMGDDSVFRNFPGAWRVIQGSGVNPPGQTFGLLLPPGSEVQYPLGMYKDDRYAIRVFWRIATPSVLLSDQQFFIKINSNQFGITLEPDTSEHNYTVPPANYNSNADGSYTLGLWNPADVPDVGLEISYICVVDTTQRGGNSAYVPASCQACIFTPSLNPFELISNLFAWLVCVVRRLFECELIAVLEGIWSVVNDILLFCASFGLWLSRTLSAFVQNQGENAVITARYVGGHLNNVGSAINTQANAIGASFDYAIFQSGVADTSNQISGGVQNIPIAIGNGLNQVGGLMNSAVNVGVDAIGLIGNLVNLFLQAIGYLLYIVPIIFSSIVDGFNMGAFAPISGSPTCTEPTTFLYYPCLGFYVLDNTVFQGPAFYLAPVLLAVMAWDTLVWAIQRFKDAFSR